MKDNSLFLALSFVLVNKVYAPSFNSELNLSFFGRIVVSLKSHFCTVQKTFQFSSSNVPEKRVL